MNQDLIPPEILYHSHLSDLYESFRDSGKVLIENKLFPQDHTKAIDFQLRTENDPIGSKFYVELAKLIAVQKTRSKCKVPLAHLAKAAGNVEEFEYEDSVWMKLTSRQQNKYAKRAHEAVALAAKIVGGRSGNKHCSYAGKKRRENQLKAQDAWRKKQVAFNHATGKYFTLPSTQKKRESSLAEMYSIMKGVETISKRKEYQWASCVITCPARMHPNPLWGVNCWDGTLPDVGAKWLSEGWKKIRARLKKSNIILSGGWFKESHQDGTVHVNFYLVFKKGDYRKVEKAFRAVFGHSKKAIKMSLGAHPKAVSALEKKGIKPASFASYAMKNFMNGHKKWGNDDFSFSEETTAAAFGYRRYGFFGLPKISTWREPRKLKTCPQTPLLAAVWHAAKRGDAATWIALCGGLACRPKLRPIQPVLIKVEGCIQKQIVGVAAILDNQLDDEFVRTRTPKEWQIKDLKDFLKSRTVKISNKKQQVTVTVNYPRVGLQEATYNYKKFKNGEYNIYSPPLNYTCIAINT